MILDIVNIWRQKLEVAAADYKYIFLNHATHIQEGMTHELCMAEFPGMAEYWVGCVWNSHLPPSCLTHSLQCLQEKQESKYGNSETIRAHTSP